MKKEILVNVLNANKNIIVSGDIDTGKSSNVINPLINEMINKKESLLILDSKEEYINKYFNKAKENGYNTIVINLRNPKKSNGWNPLEYPYKLYKKGSTDKAIDYLGKIAKTIFSDEESSDQFWSNSAADYFTGIILSLFEDATKDQINISNFNLMMVLGEEKIGLTTYLREYFYTKKPTNPAYVLASGTVYAPNETRGGILSLAKQKIKSIVAKENLVQMLNKTTFDIEKIKKESTAIFIIAKDENINTNNIATMFIEQLYQILVESNSHNKFNFILDNIEIIGKMNDLTEMLSSCLSRKIQFYITSRSLETINEMYGKYINTLCYNIKTTNSTIEFNIEGINKKIENKKENIENNNKKVEYPILEPSKITTFDIRKFVKKKKINKMEKLVNNYNKNNKSLQTTNNSKKANLNFDIDDLVKKIDDKIEELEKEEKEMNNNTK